MGVRDQAESLRMSGDTNPLPFGIDKMMAKLTKVRLRGGVVGKISTVLIVVTVSLASVACAIGSVWLASAIVTMIFSLVLYFCNRLINFADKHPQAALFEGAEFLAHEQLRLGIKGQPPIVIVPGDLTTDPEAPIPPPLLTDAKKPDNGDDAPPAEGAL